MSAAGEVRAIFYRNNFTRNKKQLALIWAAKWVRCPKCHAPSGKPCVNMSKSKTEHTFWPHEERIDYELLLEKLKVRGYK